MPKNQLRERMFWSSDINRPDTTIDLEFFRNILTDKVKIRFYFFSLSLDIYIIS